MSADIVTIGRFCPIISVYYVIVKEFKGVHRCIKVLLHGQNICRIFAALENIKAFIL